MIPTTVTQYERRPRSFNTRYSRSQCAAGAMMQTARETAGLTREELAHRTHLASHERSNLVHGKHHDYECPTPECAKREAQQVRWIKTAERTSQQQFDKKRSERAALGYDQDAPYDRFWTEYLELIDLANSEASETELREAIRQHIVDQRAAVKAERERNDTESAQRLADAVLTGRLDRSELQREFNFTALHRALLIIAEHQAAND